MDMALGGDQGGSIRMPSAFCGIVGLKPTYGLVPYTGIVPLEFTLDHTGPMAKNVHDTALMLEVKHLECNVGFHGFGHDFQKRASLTQAKCMKI